MSPSGAKLSAPYSGRPCAFSKMNLGLFPIAWTGPILWIPTCNAHEGSFTPGGTEAPVAKTLASRA